MDLLFQQRVPGHYMAKRGHGILSCCMVDDRQMGRLCAK